MTTSDQLAIVNEGCLRDGDSAFVLAEGSLILTDWRKVRRLLLIVKSKSKQNFAIFVYVSKNFPVQSPDDLMIESVLPIDSDFKCDIDMGDGSGTTAAGAAPTTTSEAVYIKITSKVTKKKHLMVEMLPGYHTQNFVGEIFRLTEALPPASINKNPSEKEESAEADSFAWTEKYLKLTATTPSMAQKKPLTSNEKDNDGSSESPEMSLNREEIAKGITHVAARESVVKYQMAMKEELFTEINEFSILCATWNVNGQSPQMGQSLIQWLGSSNEPPDLYAVGFQELDLSKEAYVVRDSPKEDEWYDAVYQSLHPNGKYEKVKLIRLVGMMLIVFVKEDHARYITNVSAYTVGTGILGKLGNKGGVTIRLEFHNTSICFVNSHLAADVSQCERRNQDYNDICERTIFTDFSPAKTINDHDMIYWLGDLNYRINDIDCGFVKDLIKDNALEQLFTLDQFHQQKNQRKIFVGFNEGPITFIPTYKYDLGTDDWDSSEKSRTPSWTDRILWKGKHIQQTYYGSTMDLKLSDHKPVSAFFKSGIKVVDPVKYRKIYEDIMKKLDKLENEFLPQVTVDTTEIDFETVRFIEPVTKTLVIANTGQVPVQFEFIKKLNDLNYCKPWLLIQPSSGFIIPGDKTDISIELFVDKKTAGSLNSGADQMYDILVLHLIGGKDIFITVSGSYQRSCFGSSINALVRLVVPISELSVGKIVEMEKMSDSRDPSREDDPYPVPKELWFLCDLITSLGLQNEQLFLQPGLRAEMIVLRDWLDTGLPVDTPTVSIHSAAETLLLFLDSLRKPVIPYSMYKQCLECSPNYLQCKQLVSQLPAHHKNVFNYMCAFLREVIRHSAQNGIDPKILAALFASIFVRDPPETNLGSGIKAHANQQLLDNKKAAFVYHFLVNDPD